MPSLWSTSRATPPPIIKIPTLASTPPTMLSAIGKATDEFSISASTFTSLRSSGIRNARDE